MAVNNKTLQSFFNKQKKPKIDALISLNKAKKPKNICHNKKENTTNKKTGIKLVPNQDQIGTKPGSNRNQTGIKKNPNWYQTGIATGITSDIKLVSNQDQTGIKIGFFSLAGLQKKICFIIYKLCQISRNKKTDAVSIIQLTNQCQGTIGSVKIAIRRLINKGLLLREDFKIGRGGWSVYSIPNNVYQEILNFETQAKLVSNQYQTSTKLVSELVSELVSPVSSSSSNNQYINTTTTGGANFENKPLPTEWEKLDIEPLASIGFTKTHISQIVNQNKLMPQLVQDSIYSFAFDLQENNKAKTIKGDPINFFMGILSTGRVYTFASNYESPQDRSLRLYAESKRKVEQKRIELEREVATLAFNEWLSMLTEEQKRKFLPEIFRNTPRLEKNKLLESSARAHFEAEIWPDKKNEIMKTSRPNPIEAIEPIKPKEVMIEETKP